MTALYFGFPVSGKSPFLISSLRQNHAKVCWKEFLARKAGVHPPRETKKDTRETFRARYNRYLERYDAAVNAHGCALVVAGFDESPEYLVALNFPVEKHALIRSVDLAHMHRVADDPKSRELLRAFSAVLGFEYQEPQWHEITYWGSLYA